LYVNKENKNMQETLARTPEQYVPAAPYEVDSPEKQVAFLDGNGVERSPHPNALECYASPEIVEEVTQHFEGAEEGIKEINEAIDGLEAPFPSEEKPFNPLTEELLDRVKQAVAVQLPKLTETRVSTVHEQVTTGRLIKKTKTVARSVEEEVSVEGFTSSSEGQDQKKAWKEIAYKASHKGDYIDLESVDGLDALEGHVVNKLEELLVSDERMPSEPHGKKLPLLAKKIRDAEMSLEDIDLLTWEDIEQLVPEAEAWFEDIRVLGSSLELRTKIKRLADLQAKLMAISPIACQTISRVYYSDELIGKLHKAKNRMNDTYNRLASLLDHQEFTPKDTFIEDQRRSIENFFKYTQNANQILLHGTKFIPRIIESGALKPAANMEDGEFTFNTSRTNIRAASATGDVNGSRAVHWAGPDSLSYASNRKIREQDIRGIVAGTLHVREDHPWVNQEVEKGGFGEALLVARVGDVVQRTPFGGYKEVSLGANRGEARVMARYGLVELTPNGWAKLAEKEPVKGPSDAAYIAAPHNHGVVGLYDYEYPIDELMIGIPEADPEKTLVLLREKGWSEEKIASHTFRYSSDRQDRVDLQRRMYREPKYPHTLVAPIAMETGLD
jgi:hypothetical protein